MRKWLILGAVGVIAASIWCAVIGQVANGVNSEDGLYPWLSAQGSSILSKGKPGAEKQGCSSRSEKISFRDGYSAVACVYGDNLLTRVASYTNQGGLSVIGVAFPGEEKYSEIYGVCEGSRSCAYSASRDTLVDSGTSKFYMGFVKNLVKNVNPINGLPYYQFSRSELSHYISAGRPMVFNAATVSINGKWAVVEAYEYGFVRVDLDTFHERRIAISGARYGVANDPSFELAISNSGREFSVVGYRTGISLYQIDNYCGDVLTAQSMYYFMNPSVPCRQASLSTDLFAGFISAHTPIFNADGSRLGLTIKTILGRERVVAAPSITIPIDQSAYQYLALGDSYSSGEGETDGRFYKMGTDESANKCHLGTRSYPYLLVPLWGASTGRSVACSGAQIKDISAAGAYYGQKGQVSSIASEAEAANLQALTDFMPGIVQQLQFVDMYQPKVVTVGVGGNDAGLMDKLSSCVGAGVCEWAKDPGKRMASAKEIQSLYAPLRAMITALKSTRPGVAIYLVGYPLIINESRFASCGLILGSLLSQEEREFMGESIKLVNDAMRAAASAENVTFVDIQDALIGHRLCEGDSLAMNGIRVGDDVAPIKNLSALKLIGAESFHPTPFGHALIANRILGQVPNLEVYECTSCNADTTPQNLSTYWTKGVAGTEEIHLAKRNLFSTDEHTAGKPASIKLPPQSFAPLTDIKVRYGSGSKLLHATKASEAGELIYELQIPEDSESGYYTVQVIGLSWSGDLVDYYQVISVAGNDDAIFDDTHAAIPSSSKTTLNGVRERNESNNSLSTQNPFNGAVLGLSQITGATGDSSKHGAGLPSSALGPRKVNSSSNAGVVVVLVAAGISSLCVAIFLLYRYIIRSST